MATRDKTLKTALIGLRHPHIGSFGMEKPSYIHTLKQLQGVELVAYCEDTDSKRLDLARESDPAAHHYSSVDDLIANEDFDLAFVVLPANEIPVVGIKLAEAGKHFYMEKQFARRAEDLAELARVVRRNGVKVTPGYPWRFHPAAQDLRRFIDEGKLGKPLSVETRQITHQVGPGGRDPNHFMYRDDTEGGGILHMLGGHHLEIMRFLMGCEVKSVQAMVGRPVGNMEEPLEDIAIVAMEYENGAFGSVHTGYLHPRAWGGKDACLVYRGMEGWAEWTPVGAPTLEVRSTAPEWSGSSERTLHYSLEPYTGYLGQKWLLDWLQGFVDDVLAGREPSLTVVDALRVLESIDAAYESARTGQRIEVEYSALATV